MKYYPLECVDRMLETEPPEKTLQMMKDKDMCDPDSTVADLEDYAFDLFFFTPEYKGKFEKWNKEIMYNTRVNKLFFPMYSMKDFDQRSTEWKDVLTTNLVLSTWMKFKMVYKIDNDFFHEIKQTENLITSKEMFDKLPFKCFFIDLTEVDNIANFKGAWVYITTDDIHGNKDFYSVNIYMVQNDNFTFFTYYSWYKFTEEQQEVEWHSDDLPKSDFIARTFVGEDDLMTKDIRSLLNNPTDFTKDGLIDVTLDMRDEYDPRESIVVSIFQIMSFIAIDASDVNENATTKSTYTRISFLKFVCGMLVFSMVKLFVLLNENIKSILKEKMILLKAKIVNQ